MENSVIRKVLCFLKLSSLSLFLFISGLSFFNELQAAPSLASSPHKTLETGQVSEYYAYQRWKQKKDSSFQSRIDFGAKTHFFQHSFKAGPKDAPELDWSDKGIGEDPFTFGWETRLNFTFDQNHSLEFHYEGFSLSSFTTGKSSNISFNDSTIPAGSDLDIHSQLHHFSLKYRHGLFNPEYLNKGNLFLQISLAYDALRLALNSDAFPIENDSQNFEEILPFPMLGISYQQELFLNHTFNFQAEGIMLPQLPTFQKRFDNDLDQETLYVRLSIEDRWKISEWFAFLSYARWQLFEHRLTTKNSEDLFQFHSFQLGLSLSFTF